MSEAVLLLQPELAPDFLKIYRERPDLVDCVRQERPLHTAKIAGKDKALCRAVCLDLMLKRPKTQICAEYGVGWETVCEIERVMAVRGELRGLAQAISDNLAGCILLMGFRLKEALLDGSFSAAQIPIAMGVLIDKRSQLDAGVVPGTGRTETELTRDSVLAGLEVFDLARRTADAESARRAAQVAGAEECIDVTATVDTAMDTAQAIPSPVDWSGARVAEVPSAGAEVQAGGGGGGLRAGGTTEDRWEGPPKI